LRAACLVWFLLAFALPAATADEEKILNVYNWADYIGPTTIADFEREFGIRVNYDLYDATAVVSAKLLAGNTGYDVVLQALRYSARLMPIGVFQPLEKSKLPLWPNLDPWVLKAMARYDENNTFAAPYMWGTTGFMYNIDMVLERMPDAPLDSASMLFDPAIASRFADCGITWLESSTTVIPMAMMYLGYEPHSLDPAQLAETEAVLKSVRPYVRYISSSMGTNDMGNKEVCVAMAWSGDYILAQNRAEEAGVDIRLGYTAPREGSLLWFDSLLIPADAPHPGNAHLFLNFLMRPEVIARISEFTGYANANLASMPLLDARLVNNPAAYPPMESRQGWQAGLLYDPKRERVRSRLWSRVKTGL